MLTACGTYTVDREKTKIEKMELKDRMKDALVIECSQCKETEIYTFIPLLRYDFEEMLIQKGWVVDGNKVRCEYCKFVEPLVK